MHEIYEFWYWYWYSYEYSYEYEYINIKYDDLELMKFVKVKA